MKMVLETVVLAFVALSGAWGAEVAKLEPNATLRFDFPELPNTLATLDTGEKAPARLTAQLPENYSREGR